MGTRRGESRVAGRRHVRLRRVSSRVCRHAGVQRFLGVGNVSLTHLERHERVQSNISMALRARGRAHFT